MKSTEEKIKEALGKFIIKDKEKLEKQQAYYKKLTTNGIAKKQQFNLKALSLI